MLVDPTCDVRMWDVLKFTIGYPRRLLVCSVLCGINVHFLGSSRICAGDDCPACKSGVASKFSGYVAVLAAGKRQLLRLTGMSATMGMNKGLWQAGMIIDVDKNKERHPLRVIGLGQSSDFSSSSRVGPVELLGVVARLHGLPGFDETWALEDALRALEKNAKTAILIALRVANE